MNNKEFLMTFATEYFALTGERLSRPIIEEIYEGLPISAADVVQSSLSLTTFEACKLLHCSQSTLKRKDFRLSALSSDKALLLIRVVQYGEDTFGDNLHLCKWIRSPSLAFDNKTPLEIMSFSIGIDLVLESLRRQKLSFVA